MPVALRADVAEATGESTIAAGLELMLQTIEIHSDLAAIPEDPEETVRQTLETLITVKSTVIDVTTVATMTGASIEIAMTDPTIFVEILSLDQTLASPLTYAQLMQ